MKTSIAFFGSSPFSKIVLGELATAGFTPTLVIEDSGTRVSSEELEKKMPPGGWDIFIVASFGQIIPADVLAMPKRGALNVHPSLLPKYRGPSPLQSAILADDRNTGVSIMLMDRHVDHGPVVAQEKVTVHVWPPSYDRMEITLAGAVEKLLAKILPDWLARKIAGVAQNHALATTTAKITKTDGELGFDQAAKKFTGDPYQDFLKIQALARWPKAHFFIERKGRRQRVVIAAARFEEGQAPVSGKKTGSLVIERVTPEGKQEMSWPDFAKGYL